MDAMGLALGTAERLTGGTEEACSAPGSGRGTRTGCRCKSAGCVKVQALQLTMRFIGCFEGECLGEEIRGAERGGSRLDVGGGILMCD